MGRSTRQQPKLPTKSSFIAKRPKDYSKQNLLRKKYAKQELLSSTQRSTKLNAVMQMDPPGSRRRLGRNPIAEQQQDSSSSPTDAESSNEAVPSGSSNSAECRRSSRKKTIKFDVRDLLNKNRKSHKIQIEARIDSNAPKIGAGQISKAELDSKQKNFIEKSAIFRRYSISENKLPPRPPPPPGALIHTIQQCVGELEQLPLDGGELNLAAISPIARRLSRTQDILTATMMKPKQVSSLIVTKLESASTSKPAVPPAEASAPPARRRAFGACEPSTSTAIQKMPQKRGRKPKTKVFTESTTESSSTSTSSASSLSSSASSSSSDSFDLSANKRKSGENENSKEELDVIGSRVSMLDENSTTGIDLKENLDASAVTLPQPTILDDSMHNSSDDSFVAAEDDIFTSRIHSSDESTMGSITTSPKGRRVDEISLFGRSNSTETNSSDDSEKRRRKIRVAVKRVVLTPQKSPLGSSFGKTTEPIELLSSTNDENSNEDSITNKTKISTKQFIPKQVEKCATPPIILLESDNSNAASVGSSVIEIISCSGTPIEEPEPEPSSNTRRGRSCKLSEEAFTKIKALQMKAVQKSNVPQNAEVSLKNRSSSRKSAPLLPIQTIAASSSSPSPKYDAQSIEDVNSPKNVMVEVEDDVICKDISLGQNQKVSPNIVQLNKKETEDICEQKSECSEEKGSPQVRSLRSAQSVQVRPLTPAKSKRQRKINKAQADTDNPSEHDTQTQAEVLDKEVLPILSKDGQLESVKILESSLPDERQIPTSKELTRSDSPKSQSAVSQTEKILSSQSDEQDQVVSFKQTRSRGLKKQDKLDEPNLTEDQIVAKDPTITSEKELELKTEEKTNERTEEQESSKSEKESTFDSADRSSNDTTTSDRRRESLRLRSSLLPTKKEPSKKISKVIAKSNTPDSSSDSSECHEKSPENRIEIKSANLIDDKFKEETSSLCSESSSNGSSTSSSSLSSSSSTITASSSSTSSSSSSSSSTSSSSSSSSDGRSTRSSRNTKKLSNEKQPQVETIRTKSPITPENINKSQSTKSDSDNSENFARTDSIKNKYSDIKFNELEQLMEGRKPARWSSEHKRDTDESESSDAIQHTSKTRSGRSRGRFEREEEMRKKLPKKHLQQDLIASVVEVDKTAVEETSIKKTNDIRDESTKNEESKTEDPTTDTSLNPRAKSKKRTRRFVPIKYSSSESGTLSDDGNPSTQKSSFRLTRTRRKTISSASELEEFPSDNLSPPDLALEYMPRKSKQSEVKLHELTEKKDEKLIKSKKVEDDKSAVDLKNEQNTISGSKTEEESTMKATFVRSAKGSRYASKCTSGEKKEDCTDISKESESDNSSMDSGSKQELQEPASPSSSCSSTVDGQVGVARERKVTRLSLRTKVGDPKNNESHSSSSLFNNKERALKNLQRDTEDKVPDTSSEYKESQQECDLKDDQAKKPAVQALEDVRCIPEENCLQNKDLLAKSSDVLDSVVGSQSISPKQKKGTKFFAKSPIVLRSKQESKNDETEKPKEAHDGEKPYDNKTSEICSTKYEPLNDALQKSPNLRKVSHLNPKSLDMVPSPEIKIHDNLAGKDKEDEVLQENKDDNSKATEIAKFSGTRKGTRLSMKQFETMNLEKNIKENDDKETEPESKSMDVLKPDEIVKTPRQKKPTRFSPKSAEKLIHEDQHSKEVSTKTDETDGQNKQDLFTPTKRKTSNLAPKSLNLKDIELTQQDNYQSIIAPTGVSQLKSGSEAAIDGTYESKILEKTIQEPLDNSLSDTLKLTETPKRKRKPTRFSPKSPDKPSTEEEANLREVSTDEKIEGAPLGRIDEVKKIEKHSSVSTSPTVLQPEGLVKTPRARKGTRFSPKNPDNIQIIQELPKTKESQPAISVETNEENPCASDITEVSNLSLSIEQPTKLARARKGTRFQTKGSENLQIVEELNKALDDSQSAISTVFEKPDVLSSSFSETTVKSPRTKKGARFSLQSADDSSTNQDITKVELLIKKPPTELEDRQDDITKASKQKEKTAENESFGYDKVPVPADVSIMPTTSGEQTDPITENNSGQKNRSETAVEISQEPSDLIQNVAGSSNSLPIKESVLEEDATKYLEQTIQSAPLSTSIIPTPKTELTSKKNIKKQLQSMLDSLTSEEKAPAQKETTPRRKRKTLGQQQEAITPTQDSLTTKKTDIDMKVCSSDSNLSDDSNKLQEGTTKTDQKQTPRRQLDSSFIESLEKSLLRPISTKKSTKKMEKDKETVVVHSPKPAKEESTKITTKKSQEPYEELKKKSETFSPKLKKKQSKGSPKMDKKHSEEQTTSKRKNLAAAKAKDLEEIKPKESESNVSDMLNNSMNKQSSEVIASDVVITQVPKTKAETKFFSPEKPLIQTPIAVIEEPVAPVVMVKEKSPDLLPDPLKDIEKFIEDGVNLLKRCYKIDADDDASLDRDILKPEEMMTPKKCKLDESLAEGKPEDSPRDDDNSNSNSESSTMTTNTSTSEVDTPNGIRRSHRIKNNTKSTKFLVGRGLVRERERFSTKDDEKTIYSIDDQKMDLAEVEAKNSKFLKDMEERLSNFRVIRENEYKCERVISKEAKRMLCDCFLTQEEEVRGELGCGEDCLNRLLMIECGADCTVRERCTNRRFNKFLYSPCRVFRTEKKGFGIMADIEILPGEFIMEYVGEVINGNEFEFRINEYSKDKNKHYYFMALRSDAVIDATAKGNISRFINHSCDPNAETQKWTVNGELRIGFFSRKSIMPGEEITFDYQYQRYGKEAQRCYCESANCRGWIGAEPSSEEEEEYEGVDEEDESEESEEEEPTEAVVPVPVVPSPTPPIIAVPNVEEQSLELVVPKEVPAIDVKTVPSPQPVAVPTPLTQPLPTEVPKVQKELPLKKKKEKKRLLEEKLKRREPKQFLEDPDIEDEVRFLVKCGLRNQADTLRLSRLIVRAKLLETRINLLQILRQGELPCRRLFLDYHGLRLLHGWMSEVIDTRDTEKGMEIRMELLSALECLPISNKTMLTDSKVYQTVRDWSNNKESHSPSDGSPKEAIANISSGSPTLVATDASSELQKLAAKLVHTWDNLPEVFRIPKRERIEQMKEHEREADRQYKVLGKGLMSGSDRNRNRERFISKSGQKGRFKWSKEKERERANERRKYAQNNSCGKDGADKSAGPLTGESHLSKEQRRELFAAKVARDEAEKRQAEERREFDIKCRFFGLDPKRMKPENMPFCVNPSTGQWYSTDKKAISTPPSYAHVQVPVKPKSTNPEDYRLPEMDLPPLWKFAISPKGKIYYYHVKIRIPQWEPPIKILPLAGQHDTAVKNSESDSSTAGINDSSEDDIEVIKGLDPVKLQTYIEKKIEDRRLQRYNRLVEEKPISPRKEEDRIYNQMEVRKYKENKEKIRKRKEDIRRRRDVIGKPQGTVDSSNLSETTEACESVADALPIQDYLLSSEEEDILKAECNNSPLIDKIVQGDKIVDELDALQRKRSLKRSLPIRDKYEHKKRKVDKNKDSSKSTKRNKDGEGGSSSSKYRKVREKFRCEIAGIIVQHLKPYRNETCFTGKILTNDDFNHLARKLTHFVMVKELKYCESIGQTLIVTESVKNKSREFIKKYMAKYGKVYVRPKNDPEFKDIPFL